MEIRKTRPEELDVLLKMYETHADLWQLTEMLLSGETLILLHS